MPRLHDLNKRRKITEGVEVGVFLHVVVVGVAVLDRRLEQVNGSLRTVATFCLVFLGERMRGQGIGTGCIVVQSRFLRLFLECGVQLLERLVGSLAQFRCHDDRQVKPGTLGGVGLLELRQISNGLILVTEAGMGEGTGLIDHGGLRGPLQDGVQVVDGFLAIATLEVSICPIEPSFQIIRLCLEGGFRSLQSRGSALLRAGRWGFRSEIEVDQGASLLSEHAGEVRFR